MFSQGTLAGLRPAVVALIASAGVSILSLALFGDGVASAAAFNWLGAGLFAAAFVILRRFKPDPILVMSGCGVLGGVLYLLVGGAV